MVSAHKHIVGALMQIQYTFNPSTKLCFEAYSGKKRLIEEQLEEIMFIVVTHVCHV